MIYQLSSGLDRNKVFLTNFSEIESRFDCSYYKPEFREFYRRIEQVENTLEPISRNAKVICGPFGSSITTKDYTNSGIPLIRISNIDSDGKLSEKGIVYISERLASELAAYKVYENDIIVSQRGSLGMVSVVPNNLSGAVISANLIAIKNLSSMTPEYLQTIISTTIGQKQIQRKTSGQVQTKITTDDIKGLLVPLFDSSRQAQIVEKMANVFASKNRKETEAQQLLDSIDDYLLGELGIELPEQEDNTIESHMFTRRLSEISGYRFDPNTYKKERLDAIYSIENGIFDAKPLFQVLYHKAEKTSVIEEGTTYIGLENIESNTGELIKTEEKESISSAAIFGRDDILFPKLRPYLNKVFYSDIEGLCSTEFHVLHSTSQSNEYIANFLRSKVVVAQTKNLMSGNTLPRLQYEDIQKLLITIPYIEKQEEIINHINAIRNQAKDLRQQAKTDLEQAKQEVEAMILGEDEKMA